jgi:hypothetical protein
MRRILLHCAALEKARGRDKPAMQSNDWPRACALI